MIDMMDLTITAAVIMFSKGMLEIAGPFSSFVPDHALSAGSNAGSYDISLRLPPKFMKEQGWLI